MLLVVILTFQLLPMGVFATYGNISNGELGVDLSTLKKDDAINWPIKVYDYLSDGMLFEWNDNTSIKDIPDGKDDVNSTVPYGGGSAPPITKLGYDFTFDSDREGDYTSWSSDWSYSPAYYKAKTDYGDEYNVTKVQPVDYQTPMHMHITGNNNTGNRNLLMSRFSNAASTSGNIRYMVLVYRSKGLYDNQLFQLRLTNNTAFNSVLKQGFYKLPDTKNDDWSYVVIDLQSVVGASSSIYYVWFDFYTTLDKNNWSGSNSGFNSGNYLDLTHVAYFSELGQAKIYGTEAAKFSNNPGEYLRSSRTFTGTVTTVTPSVARPNQIFSLNYYWRDEKSADGTLNGPTMADSVAAGTSITYGMDFTTTSKDRGFYTNGYTTASYWTWANGSQQTYPYTDSNYGTTGYHTVNMDPIGVEKHAESNGAMYLRLTASKNSKILLSKFREDYVAQAGDVWVPPTSAVNYVVLVYRSNGLDVDDHYGFWAQGHQASTANYTNNTAGVWKYAGLTPDNTDWTTYNKVNKLSFNTANSGWQYVAVNLTDTIKEKDGMMQYITGVNRTGLYLPAMSEGESLDLAYVAYFSDKAVADAFGQSAVNYMSSAPTITKTSVSKTYGTGRVWKSGSNKGFGMLFSGGHGNWKNPGTDTSGGTAGGENKTDAYGYNTWMIGYATNELGNSVYNTNRMDPMTGQKYSAKYTTDSSKVYQSGVSGTTNNIFMIYTGDTRSNDGDTSNGSTFNTEVLDFDGYQLLENITSGLMTAGLLEGSLRTVLVDGTTYRVPVYRQETVEYIAYLLVNALRIPKRDVKGSYNTNFIAGAASEQYGGVDLNGDGAIGFCDLDGDPRNGNETNEVSVDLATALRHCLGITLPINADVGSFSPKYGSDADVAYQKTLGTYAETLAKDELLMGDFRDCRYSIETAMDAAYYMLNNLFIGNSFNQKQDDYYYLEMPSAQVTTNNHSGYAYVFDAGFTSGSLDKNAASALNYSPVINANGQAGTGTISMNNVTGKMQFDFGTSYSSITTMFPFLPITGATGEYAGGTYSYCFWDDAQRVITNTPDSFYRPVAGSTDSSFYRRNYNYVIASNGEFVYNEAESLFFEFEGDDDVYLFINGELVLDIGAAHSITKVYIDVNDYVTKARQVLKDKGLAKYGYESDMSIAEFDAMISADMLEEYTYDANGRITGSKTVPNPFSAEEIAELKRWVRLDLVDGQICQFDFYYMERHSWGANMRIVTNMHITDPALKVEKSAFQYGQEIEYGGVIDPTSSLEYNFSMTNSGNQKLYNLTFQDDVIGVKLDPINGLIVENSKNGLYVMDSAGKSLEAKDLTAVVSGYDGMGRYMEVPVSFPEVNGDNGQTALKNFLNSLQAEGTQSGLDDSEITHAGSGLWVDATVRIKGIHYMLTPEQTAAGSVHNTVYMTATTKMDPGKVGNKTLKSDADHVIYTSGFPVHYQWAGHNIFIKMSHVLAEAWEEANTAGTQLSLYQNFFMAAGTDLSNIHYALCDKYGRTGGNYPYQTPFKDAGNNLGYLINYPEPGVYTFYILMYLDEGTTASGTKIDYPETGINADDITEGQYAILRSQVYVADVEDSIFVLDYGLSTETLDMGGELFKNDYLFGPYGTIRAKLMGVTNHEPTYRDPEDKELYGTDYCRIDFVAQNLENGNVVKTSDGVFKVNLSIPESGKLIAYDAFTGQYTLTGVGTITISATVPVPASANAENLWATPYLYYWYDDGTTGPSWPGTPMRDLGGAGKYELEIPGDVSKVIINNGSAALQTDDLVITPGLDCNITVTQSGNVVDATIDTIVEDVVVHAKVPAGWSEVYLHYWDDHQNSTTFPGEKMTLNGGYYELTIPGNITNVIISDGNHHQSGDQKIYAGKDVWLELTDEVVGRVENDDATVTTYYKTTVKYTLSAGYKLHASVPASWKDDVYLYYWRSGLTDDEMTWPGIKLKKGDFGWYSLDGLVPAEVTQIIINDGTDGNNHQTVDLTVTPGLETWIMVDDHVIADGHNKGKYTAAVAYGSESSSAGLTFTPQKFMDSINDLWLAITVHSTSANPNSLADKTVNIHNEVQLFKKVSILPATVVYYEDTFADIQYNKTGNADGNVFIHHGNGSGRLSQSIDQDMPYGQDPTYQGDGNNLHSGESMTKVQIKNQTSIATFSFKGTGFELVGRTNAFDSATTVARVYKADQYVEGAFDAYIAAVEKYNEDLIKYQNGELAQAPTAPTAPEVFKIVPVFTQFDHGNDGGAETIGQVPVLRVTDMEYGEYVVELSGVPAFTYNPDYSVSGIKDSYVYIDGLRIFQPMGPTHEAYSDKENGAQILELRDLIANGVVGVGALNGDTLSFSTGTLTWTESLHDNDFDPSTLDTYEGVIVGSTGDYLIQGPNNEVYMEGNTINSALVFYVTENAGAKAHELQIAVRGLDYAKFYGAGSTAVDAQLQYGILKPDGTYDWKHLACVVSGTEQYYSIPYAECPMDADGKYQIALRAVNANNGTNALVSYSNLKVNGMTVEKVDGMGEGSVLYYQNGMLVQPEYELVITDASFEVLYTVPFKGNKVVLPLVDDVTYVHLRVTMNGEAKDFFAKGDSGSSKVVDFYSEDVNSSRGAMGVYKGQGTATFTVNHKTKDMLTLSYCVHTWDAGVITTAADCTHTGIKTYTCTGCGEKRYEVAEKNSAHTYSGGNCVRCGVEEPEYYLVGNINGADYGFGDYDWQNKGEYKFVDGKLVVTFTNNSYVFVKRYDPDVDNFQWFMTQTYVDANGHSGVLFNTNTGASEKMYVPGGTEITFTLVENGDGSLTLSYEKHCVHNWDNGTILLAPTCTAEGEIEYYCSKCGKTRSESIAIVPHDHQNGVCVYCGDLQMTTIYLENVAEWESVYIYTWTDASGQTPKVEYNGTWPGERMWLEEDEVFSMEIPVIANLVFSNGSGSKTVDLTVPTNGNNMYDNLSNQWEVKNQAVNYYLIGNINGANYGCEEDAENLGQYKFVDGQVVATFNQDSYVFVKTTGNANWYMTDGWLGMNPGTVTLYNSTITGESSDKMHVPGNVELTFTLVDNGDDTFQLTAHAWGLTEKQLPTCTEDGFASYACNLEGCEATRTDVLPATGHDFDPETGECGNPSCTTLETYRVYFQNTEGWTNVNIYAWTDGFGEYTGSWPGSPMQAVDGEAGLYYYDVPLKADAIIFNNGSAKTSDLLAPKVADKVYFFNAGQWVNLGEEPEYVEPPKVYFTPHANWTQAGARFAAYFLAGGPDTWVSMTDADGDGTYECAIPNGYSKVIFCRMNPSNEDNQWGSDGSHKWNQTADLLLPTDGTNHYVLTGGEWDGVSGEWRTMEAAASVYSVRKTRNSSAAKEQTVISKAEAGELQLPEIYLPSFGDASVNLPSIKQQLMSDSVYGELDEFVPDVKEEVKINSASLTLSDDITVVYKATVPAGSTNVHMVFHFNGNKTTVTDYTINADGKYCFNFEGVNPQLMGDNIRAELFATVNGKRLSAVVAEYSVQTYCTNLLAKQVSPELQTLISDLLTYGAASQMYQGYKTDVLVTDGMNLTPSQFPGLDSSFNAQAFVGLYDANDRFTSAGLVLNNKVTLRLGVTLSQTEDTTIVLTINGTSTTYTAEDLVYENGKCYLYYDEFMATAFNVPVFATIYRDGRQVGQTLAYSVNTYIYKNQNSGNAELRQLLRAIYNYGVSAKAYAATQN